MKAHGNESSAPPAGGVQPAYDRAGVTIYHGDALSVLRALEPGSIDCCVTSPPYWGLRDYGNEPLVWDDGWIGSLGQEPSVESFVEHVARVFDEVARVLKPAGTLWLNIGDSYAVSGGPGVHGKHGQCAGRTAATLGVRERRGRRRPANLKPKDLAGVPWAVAFALRDAGWYLRQDIIWHKRNPMPESCRDRCTKAHEYVFLLSKNQTYHFDAGAIAEQAVGCQQYEKRNKRSVWSINTKSYHGAHFAAFPPALVEPCILAGCPEGGTVLDPFLGSGTTAEVAKDLGRRCVGIELSAESIELCADRVQQDVLFAGGSSEPTSMRR